MADTELLPREAELLITRAKDAAQSCHRPLQYPTDNDRIARVLLDLAEAITAWNRRSPVAEGGGWRTIDSAPKDGVCDFWLDWADDCAMLNKPLTADNPNRWFRGRLGCWGSLYKATHWRPLPSPPVPSQEGASDTGEQVRSEAQPNERTPTPR